MIVLFVNQNLRQCINFEVSIGHFTTRRIEIAVRLKYLSNGMECRPQGAIPWTDIREKHFVLRFQRIEAIDLGHLLNGWTRQTHRECQQIFLYSIAIESVLLMSFYTETKREIDSL